MLEDIYKNGYISDLDFYLAKVLSKDAKILSDDFLIAVAYLSFKVSQGDTYIDLNNQIVLGDFEKKINIENLLLSGLVAFEESQHLPLFIDKKKRLFFKKYFNYEKKIAEILIKKSNINSCNNLNLKFNEFSYQNLAVVISLLKGLTIISGGPGTGKTTTIKKIVYFMKKFNNTIKIAIVSPTGKATVRIKEIINDSDIKISTIHRLLKFSSNGLYCYYNEKRKLPYEVIIVDEVSMVDIILMYKLLIASRENTKIILIGDKDQLYSVEAGAVLGEICKINEINIFSLNFYSKISSYFNKDISQKIKIVNTNSKNLNTEFINSIIELKESYRFPSHKGIGLISKAVRESNFDLFISGIDNKEIFLIENKHPWFLNDEILKLIKNYYLKLNHISTPMEGFNILNNFKILTPYKKGISGINFINNYIKKRILNIPDIKEWYTGKPIIIEKNDYTQELFNGDIGITINEKVYFEKENDFVEILPSLLPPHSIAYAMTVHKSQGSEFNNVLIIIDDYDENNFITKEILYTAITRAKEKIYLYVNLNHLKLILNNKTKRNSILSEFLFDKFSQFVNK